MKVSYTLIIIFLNMGLEASVCPMWTEHLQVSEQGIVYIIL